VADKGGDGSVSTIEEIFQAGTKGGKSVIMVWDVDHPR